MAEVYKIGSCGDGVRKIQRALSQAGYGVSVDGCFGAKTRDAVMKFQQSRGIKPVDGIVGSVTMAALMDTGGLDIVESHISTHITRSANRPLKYIAIHYTAGTTSKNGAALQNRNVFLSRRASADYIVDDEMIVEVNPDVRNYYCWAVGDKKNPYTGGGRLYGVATNKNTISIEICSRLDKGTTAAVPNHEGWHFSDASVMRTVSLVRWLMKTYGITKENVVRHYDISGKACPGIVGWNDAAVYTTDGKATNRKSDSSKWKKFKDLL